MKDLKGKLKEEFGEWVLSPDILLNNMSLNNPVYLSDVMELLPLSMQFALLCDFLEEKGFQIDTCTYEGIHENYKYRIYISKMFIEWDFKAATKTEAIEKAIGYLNDNY